MRKLTIFPIVFFSIIIAGCAKKADQDVVKVMTFNIRYDNPRDSINAWPKRAAQVCEFIKNEKPDLIGMQEVLLRQYVILDSALTDYTSVGVGRDDGAKGGEMNPVFFRKERFDMIRTITFWLSSTPDVPGSKGWGASLPRIVTWMELADKNTHEHFFYFNTHFAHDSDSARIMSSRILLDQVAKISDGSPFIITGDFNMLPASLGYSILTGPAESVPALKDSYTISEKRPWGPVYTFNGFSDKPGTGRIDYIFVKNGMRALEHRTMIKKEGGVFISDHWPVEATILLK
ncbi:MAG: endonuclease/exonuclease/phosphatase family protein [Bacteroidales bacterium]|nr:endonuclease/exonuclease/phosphatase family protein [Bacteroidales bacterium]